MNDPGMQGAISQASKQVEEKLDGRETEEQPEHNPQKDQGQASEKFNGLIDPKEDALDFHETDRSYLHPSRWWFASTGFPLIAGTFGPMGTAFNVLALVVHWRETIPPGDDEGSGINIEDPKWLIIVNAFSLAAAVIANMALLLNMTRRVQFSIAQPITIIGWYLASLLLIADLAALPHFLDAPGQVRVFTGAFYYAIFAAGIYLIIATLLVVTNIGAYGGHYSRDFRLSMYQRTLMLQTISFMIYLLGGGAIYAHIEQWAFLDGIYFADFTLLTIGIGDFTPQTHLGRSLLFPYATGGILIVGLVISSIRSLVLERARDRISSRMTEKRREFVVKSIVRKGDLDFLTPVDSVAGDTNTKGMTERERREAEFNVMRQVQERIAKRQKWVSLFFSGFAWLLLWVIGALVFYYTEQAQSWTYFEALYFAYTCLVTIGYGDFHPTSNAGKAFFVFWTLLAIPSLTIVISHLGDTVVVIARDATLYLGEFTLLPGEESARKRLKDATGIALKKSESPNAPKFDDKDVNDNDNDDEPREKSENHFQGPGLLGDTNREVGKLDRDAEKAEHDDEEQRRRDEANPNDSHPPPRRPSGNGRKFTENRSLGELHATRKFEAIDAMDVHDYYITIARELRTILQHLDEEPPRKYSYNEWAYYLKLMGSDEDSAELHTLATVKPGRPLDQAEIQKIKHKDDKKRKKKAKNKAKTKAHPKSRRERKKERQRYHRECAEHARNAELCRHLPHLDEPDYDVSAESSEDDDGKSSSSITVGNDNLFKSASQLQNDRSDSSGSKDTPSPALPSIDVRPASGSAPSSPKRPSNAQSQSKTAPTRSSTALAPRTTLSLPTGTSSTPFSSSKSPIAPSKKEWSWLGEKSPLMGDRNEAQWVLEGLTIALMRSLRMMKEEEQALEKERRELDEERDALGREEAVLDEEEDDDDDDDDDDESDDDGGAGDGDKEVKKGKVTFAT